MEPAPLGKRALALLIDLVFIFVVIVVIGRLMHGAGVSSDLGLFLCMMLVPPGTLLLCWLIGNTPGKKLFNLHIVDWRTGEEPSFFQYVRRSILFSFLISINILSLIPVFASSKRRGFHDMLAGTMVIEA
jgi:uncharacterized RDD family membrane protein YckC